MRMLLSHKVMCGNVQCMPPQLRPLVQMAAKLSFSQTPKCFLIIHNISKRHNVGTLARSATAFGVTQVQTLPLVIF